MLQNIDPHVFHNEYSPRPYAAGDTILIFKHNRVYLTEDGSLPEAKAIFEAGVPEDDLEYLFSIDHMGFYAVRHPEEDMLTKFTAFPVTVFRSFQSQMQAKVRVDSTAPDADRLLGLAGPTAYHLYTWYKNSLFCGHCGHPTIPDTKERAMRCPACGNVIYPRISPAIVVGIRHEDKLLLTKYAKWGNTPRYALVAGFSEIGETLEQTVCREVMEEVGLKIKDLRYHGSQPWGYAGNMMIGYWALLDGEEAITLDTNELSKAVWLSREEITPELDPPDLTHTMIELFRTGKDPK